MRGIKKFTSAASLQVIVAVTASLLLYYVFGIGKNEPGIELNNSSNSIATIGQVGDNRIINEFPSPILVEAGPVQVNQEKDDGQYESQFRFLYRSPVSFSSGGLSFSYPRNCNLQHKESGPIINSGAMYFDLEIIAICDHEEKIPDGEIALGLERFKFVTD